MELNDELSEKGFVFIPKWRTEQSITELASTLGKVVKISDYYNHSMITGAQTISPKEKSNSSKWYRR